MSRQRNHASTLLKVLLNPKTGQISYDMDANYQDEDNGKRRNENVSQFCQIGQVFYSNFLPYLCLLRHLRTG